MHILLVEDNETVASVSVDLLTTLGHSVTLAINGNQAMDALKKKEGNFDALVLDAMLPDMNCEKSVRGVRSLGYAGPIIIWTGAFESCPDNLNKKELAPISVVLKGNPMHLIKRLEQLNA